MIEFFLLYLWSQGYFHHKDENLEGTSIDYKPSIRTRRKFKIFNKLEGVHANIKTGVWIFILSIAILINGYVVFWVAYPRHRMSPYSRTLPMAFASLFPITYLIFNAVVPAKKPLRELKYPTYR